MRMLTILTVGCLAMRDVFGMFQASQRAVAVKARIGSLVENLKSLQETP